MRGGVGDRGNNNKSSWGANSWHDKVIVAYAFQRELGGWPEQRSDNLQSPHASCAMPGKYRKTPVHAPKYLIGRWKAYGICIGMARHQRWVSQVMYECTASTIPQNVMKIHTASLSWNNGISMVLYGKRTKVPAISSCILQVYSSKH